MFNSHLHSVNTSRTFVQDKYSVRRATLRNVQKVCLPTQTLSQSGAGCTCSSNSSPSEAACVEILPGSLASTGEGRTGWLLSPETLRAFRRLSKEVSPSATPLTGWKRRRSSTPAPLFVITRMPTEAEEDRIIRFFQGKYLAEGVTAAVCECQPTRRLPRSVGSLSAYPFSSGLYLCSRVGKSSSELLKDSPGGAALCTMSYILLVSFCRIRERYYGVV